MSTRPGNDDELPTESRSWTGVGAFHGGPGPANGLSPGSQVGRYRIVEPIGRGGMGEVYRAEQLEPVRRTVALKLLTSRRLDTRHLAHFEVERQLLARMQHPCIAQIFDAGTLPDGAPFFAMEHIDGQSITHYCEWHRLPLAERIALFIQVCEGVQHAHGKGVIHRDLKPDNILVAEVDGRPVPKIIDFGIATVSQRSRSTSDAREVAGTPDYMSPEQADGTTDIDARSDVYSLGVVLYELLTGRRPPVADGRAAEPRAGLQTTLRPPSAALGESGDRRVAEVAAGMGGKPSWLRRTLHDEFDWVILRALRHDREARYAAPLELAEELRRWQANKPLLAVPVTRRYVFGKFVVRHRLGLASAAAVALALLLGAALLVVGLIEAREQRRIAEQQRQVAEQRQSDLEQLAGFQSAMLKGIDIEAMGAALMRLLQQQLQTGSGDAEDDAALAEFESFSARVSASDVARELIDSQLLARAAAAVDREFAGQPGLAADLQMALGDVYFAIAGYAGAEARAKEMLRLVSQANADDPRRRAMALNLLGRSLAEQGQLDVAAATLEEALGLVEGLDGNDEVRVGVELFSAIVRNERGEREPAAAALRDLHARVAALRPADDPMVSRVALGLANPLARLGRFDEARPLLENALTTQQAALGDEHSNTVATMADLAAVLGAKGDLDAALPLQREHLAIIRRKLGDSHPQTLNSVNNLGTTLLRLGRHEEARPVLEEALDARRRVLGASHPHTLRSMNNYAALLNLMGESGAALALQGEAVALRRSTLGDDHPDTLRSAFNLAIGLRDAGRLDEARREADDLLSRYRRMHGDDHAGSLDALEILASIEHEAGRGTLAEQGLRTLLAGRRRAHDAGHPLILIAAAKLFQVLDRRGDSEAETLLPDLRALAATPPDMQHQYFTDVHALREAAIRALAERDEEAP